MVAPQAGSRVAGAFIPVCTNGSRPPSYIAAGTNQRHKSLSIFFLSTVVSQILPISVSVMFWLSPNAPYAADTDV